MPAAHTYVSRVVPGPHPKEFASAEFLRTVRERAAQLTAQSSRESPKPAVHEADTGSGRDPYQAAVKRWHNC